MKNEGKGFAAKVRRELSREGLSSSQIEMIFNLSGPGLAVETARWARKLTKQDLFYLHKELKSLHFTRIEKINFFKRMNVPSPERGWPMNYKKFQAMIRAALSFRGIDIKRSPKEEFGVSL